MASLNWPRVLYLVPLEHNQVLLPGQAGRIPLANRPDLSAMLAHIYSTSPAPRKDDSIIVGCVPLASPLLSRDGLRLLTHNDEKDTARESAKPAKPAAPAQATKDDLFGFGTLARINSLHNRLGGELALIVEGISRFKISEITKERPYFEGKVDYHPNAEIDANDATKRKYAEFQQTTREFMAFVRLSSALLSTPPILTPIVTRRLESFIGKRDASDSAGVTDLMGTVLNLDHEEKLQILAAIDIPKRLELVVELLQSQLQKLQSNSRMTRPRTLGKPNMIDLDRFRQLSSLGPPNADEANDVELLKQKLDEAKLTPEASKVAHRELVRLQKMNPAQAEYQVCRTYLETLSEIPWSHVTQDRLDTEVISRARKQLDDDHYGLEKIKKRLLEYLAVLKLKQAVGADINSQIKRLHESSKSDQGLAEEKRERSAEPQEPSQAELHLLEKKRMLDKAPILLLVGPPGTGKTSLAKSVAAALGRKFHRISLGGVRDEAEVRGHRRTYVAAMPGVIVNGLKKVGVGNPVMLLDEIDKLGMANFHGDPSAAMLEVLDPEQNHTFVDHYVNIPIDLSKILFIATANSIETIPAPLLDRMEMIQLSGYTTLEKSHIATRHLLPKQIATNGLADKQVHLSSDVLDKIITSYTRESGVRNLEREIGSVCRSKAVEYAESQDGKNHKPYDPTVTLEDLEEILGIERFQEEIAEQSSRPGVVTGLVAYSSGGQGSILFIEVADMPGSGRVQLTGKLGDVLKESVEVALTWVKAHAFELGLTVDPTEDIMKQRSIHVHCPSGAIPKDGPSAGLAHTIALISLFGGRAVPPSVAMTGEISLRGKVTPVGGIKEKLIGALRAGVKTVLLPIGNRKDVKDLPQEVKDGLNIIHVKHIWEAMRHVWPDGHWPGEHRVVPMDSRL